MASIAQKTPPDPKTEQRRRIHEQAIARERAKWKLERSKRRTSGADLEKIAHDSGSLTFTQSLHRTFDISEEE